MNDDMDLVRDYVTRQSEQAFETLVRRHVNLVYSVALRQVQNPCLAEEITQAVFILLAQKTDSLKTKTILSGWLYRTTCYAAKDALRAQRRRQHHEQEAYMQSARQEASVNIAWQELAPLLEEAMMHLPQKDRDALVLRFFENKSLQEIRIATGTSEAAAKKRVSRAVEKLQKFFSKRGIHSTAAMIAGAVSANAVQAAPMALVKTTTALALTKGATASVSTITLIKGAVRIMTWTKAKTAVAAAAISLIAIGTATTVGVKTVEHHHAQQLETYFTHLDSKYLDTAPPTVLIRPSKYPGQGNHVIAAFKDGGKLIRRGAAFTELLTSAYGFGPEQMELPPDLPPGEFDMLLTVPNNQRQALQEQLKKQFGVVAHTETSQTDVLALKVVRANAPGLKISRGGGPNIWPGADGVKLLGYRISDPSGFDIAHLLGGFYNLPIVDETGLTNKYDVDVHYDPGLQGDALKKAVETMLRDQLGLSLTPDRRTTDKLIVEKTK